VASSGRPDATAGNAAPASGRLSSFLVVGSVGFLVDSAVLSLLVHVWQWSPYTARLLSFAAAVTVTWYCNRRWVFVRTSDVTREYGAYVGVQTAGAVINYTTYAMLLAFVPALARLPFLALAAGSALALFFNYSAARRWVFRERR
jgi:putative flippase GtrA